MANHTSWLVGMLLGVLALAACQPPSQPPPASPTAPAPLLVRYNLAPLLQHPHRREHDSLSYGYQGFFGPEHRRIEMVFTDVQRDPATPARYQVQGKSRYRGVVTPFTGSIIFTHVVEQPRYVPTPAGAAEEGEFEYPGTGTACSACPMYTATGRFVWQEATSAPHHGTFQGCLALDWEVQPSNSLHLAYRTDSTLTRGAGIWFEGRWRHDDKGLVRRVTWVKDIEGFANNGGAPLPELIFNSSDPSYNPRYIQLGWAGALYPQDHWWLKH